MSVKSDGPADTALRRRRGAVFFDCNEAPDILVEGLASRLELPASLRAGVDIDAALHKLIWKQPLVREGRLCLSGFHLAPDRTLPIHSPPGSYMTWVWEGSARHSSGARVLKHGAGFYARPNRPYALTAGPTGARLIVFGTSNAVPEDLLGGGCTFPDDPTTWEQPVPRDAPDD